MNYMSAKEAAELWGISQRRVAVLCAEGRIPNVEFFGNMWAIPKNVEKPMDGRGDKKTQKAACRPVIKWAGGKGQILSNISKKYPQGLGDTIDRYAEPFVGGGAVLFDVLGKYKLKEVYISDINQQLINMYIMIRDDVDRLIMRLKAYAEAFVAAEEEKRKEIYYKKRDEYNEHIFDDKDDAKLEAAALLIFLNKTCFNGLYRVNKKGLFNVPMGSYKNPLICDENNLRAVSEALKDVTIVCGDYKLSKNFMRHHQYV